MSDNIGQRNGCACIRGNSGTQSSSLCIYSHGFRYCISSTKWPKPKETGQTRAGNFQRETDLPGIFLVPRDGPSSCGLEVHCARVLEGCSHHSHRPPPRKEARKKKKAERAGRTTEHASSKVFLLHSGVRQVFHFRCLWWKNLHTRNCLALIKMCSTLCFCACSFELTKTSVNQTQFSPSTSGDTNSKTSKKEWEDVLKT